jgi:uncharacterized peroxidase-related enzyme
MTDPRAAELSSREAALVDFAIRSTQNLDTIGEADIQALKDLGLDDRSILDLTHVIGFFAYANRMVELLGVPLEDDMPTPVSSPLS